MKDSKKDYNFLKRIEKKIKVINNEYKATGEYNYFYEYLIMEEFKPFLINHIIETNYFKHIPGYENKFMQRLNNRSMEKQVKFLEDILFTNEDYDEYWFINMYSEYLLEL